MCALFAHECNSFQNSYFIQLLHFKEIKFRTFFQQRGKRIRRIEYRSQNQEGGQTFEPRRGSTLLEQPPDFAGLSTKRLMRLPWIAIFALLWYAFAYERYAPNGSFFTFLFFYCNFRFYGSVDGGNVCSRATDASVSR